MSSIALRGVSVRFNGTNVVRNIDLDVGDGEWVGIIGPNGAGKTSLLRAVAGTVASTGQIKLGGRDTGTLDARRRARLVASVPQRPVIPEGMSVSDYVLLGRTPFIGYLRSETTHDIEAARSAIERLDLSVLSGRALGSLSGGELQRAVLARALAQDAPVLLLDEPTSALDIGHQLEVLRLVARLRVEENLTVLSALHDLTLAARFADRLMLMAGGGIVVEGAPETVLRSDRISSHFGVDVQIVEDEFGVVAVVPKRESTVNGPQSSEKN